MHVIAGTGGSARHRDVVEQVVQAARRNGWDVEPLELSDLAAAVGGIDRLVVCGGDGLVHQVVQHVANTTVELAVVPIGTGNDFARAFGIEHANSIAVAVASHEAGAASRVDLLVSGDRFGASVLTAGYSGRVNRTANAMRFPAGSAKYTIAAFREVGRLRPVEARLTLRDADGAETDVIEGPLTMFAVANTAYFGGGMHICPAADPHDGLLDVLGVGAVGRFEFVRWLPSVFRGGHLDHDAVTVGRAASVEIDTAEPVWADGEPFVDPPLTVRVDPGALRLLVPDE